MLCLREATTLSTPGAILWNEKLKNFRGQKSTAGGYFRVLYLLVEFLKSLIEYSIFLGKFK